MDMNNQVKLIDADKVFRWAELCVIPVRAKDIRRAYELGLFDPDTPPVPTIKPGDNVYHNRFKAQGKVKKLSASGKRAYVVWFDGYVPSYVSLDSLEVVE